MGEPIWSFSIGTRHRPRKRPRGSTGAIVRSSTIAFFTALVAGCGCVPVSDNLWLGLRRPPAGVSESNIEQFLKTKVNHPVDDFSRDIGLFTTAFKRLGIVGWRDMGFSARVEGVVSNAPVYSTDGFLTLDLSISKLEISGEARPLHDQRFIRAEVCAPALGIQPSDFMAPGARLSVGGLLLWDGDGFFEIHPTRGDDLHVIRN